MSNTDKLREIAVKWCPWSEKTSFKRNGKDYVPFDQMVSDLTALISEGYVEKAKYDEAVRQRDEELVNQEVVRRIADKMVSEKLKKVESLLDRAAMLVGNPGTNISGSCDVACENWQKEYEEHLNCSDSHE